MIESVLIANRGEIAVRIIDTCRRLGIRTIAVYSDADAEAMHVIQADQAVHIGASPASESYLDIQRILSAAHQTGAGAVHPGYGFLSENPEFAQRVVDEGLVWIGPSASAMRALGDKARAKALAVANAVPILDGYHGEDQSAATLLSEAERIGYPVLIKASAGGGGRGMRVVELAESFTGALEAARREAQAAFGDDRVLLERYLAHPRHIEIQILGDANGNFVHLGERECSIQRRHQKLVEESPSPAVGPELRQQMGEAALRLARAAHYTNAGTVEFLVDGAGQFAFLEVNARLQVEHPVTEAVTGLDLVEFQVRIASGEALPFSQKDVAWNGHAIEVRLIAEDPIAGFLPSSGTIDHFEWPGNVRVDTWVTGGARVSPYYDSLLAKLIAWAPSRPEAIASLASALARARIDGVRHNLDLLLATLQTPDFLRGSLDTRFLESHDLAASLGKLPSEVLAAASAVDFLWRFPGGDPWQRAGAWRVARLDQPSIWERATVEHRATVSSEPGDHRVVHVNTGSVTHQVAYSGPDHVRVEGVPVPVTDLGWMRVVEFGGRTYRLQRAAALSVDASATRHGDVVAGSLVAPMPGRIVKVAVSVGEPVAQNQPLVVLEAMKMEHVVEAPHAGTVSELHVQVGDQVPAGARLLTLGAA